ncbi:prostaglandin E synthase-like [Euwallacea fornicatus]|uniref:prostaglandin E synthase-like n=1 Tax=Euwallacea fornicatus TaxID=995702 RepID=UPI00338EE167
MAENRSVPTEKMSEFGVLSINNPQFATYLIVSSLLILKMCGLTLLTIFQRYKNKVFISEEDMKMRPGATVETHPDVERVRRAFQNDLENIPAFLFIALAYLFIQVPDWVVHFLFYLFLIARTMHSIVYAIYVVPQPARAICFVLGLTVIGYLSFHVLIYGFVTGYLSKRV